jgi:anti-sigma factor RsiW
MEREEVHELTAAYALDALGDADEAEYEAHLRHCERCREELAAFQETATALAFAAPPASPPPALRERILEQAGSERPNVVPLPPRWTFRAATAVAATAAAAAVGVGVWAAGLSSSLSDERAARDRLEEATAILAQRDAERIPVEGADGALVVAPSGEAALLLTGLNPAPAGRTYEAWVIADGKPRPAGLFGVREETTVVALERPVPAGATVAVTLEPEGGVEEPTGEPLVTAETA